MTGNTTSDQPEALRERTYSWADPQVFATAARELDGLDFFKQLGDSELPPPPINATLGMALVPEQSQLAQQSDQVSDAGSSA